MKFQHRYNEFTYIIGNNISNIGSTIFSVYLTWWILVNGYSLVDLGTFLALVLIPLPFINLFGGVISDRFDRKTIIYTCDFLSTLVCFGFSYLAWKQQFELYHIYILVFTLKVIGAFYTSAGASIRVNLILPERLLKINSIYKAIESTITILIPLLTMFIVSINYDIYLMILINGISFLIAALLELKLKYISEYVKSNAKSGYIQFIDGTKAFTKNKILYIATGVAFLISVFSSASTIMLPYYALIINQENQNYTYALILGALGLGTLLGSLYLSYSKTTQISILSVTKTLIFAGIPFALFTVFYTNIWIVLALLTIAMFFLAQYNTLFSTYLQQTVPMEILGRVISIVSFFIMFAPPIGIFLFGQLGEQLSIYYFSIMGVIMLLLGCLQFFLLRNIAEEK